MLEFAPNVSNGLIILSTSMSSWSARVSLPLALVMFSLFCSLPCLRGVLEFDPSVSNVLIILSTSMSSGSAQVFL